MTGLLQEWRRGWPVLLGSATGMGAGIAMFGSAGGFFVKPLAAEFGWSRGQISMTATAVLLTSLAMPVMGRLVDKHGPRPFLLFGALVFAAAYVALAAMPASYLYFLGVLLVIGIAAGPATAPLIYMRPIVGAFASSRGLALALGLSGSVLVSIALLPLLQYVIATHGWRAGYLMMAGTTLALGVIAFVLLGRAAPAARAASSREGAAEQGHSLKEALADARFWLLALAMACANIAGGAFHSQLQPLLSDIGIPGATAALLGAWYAGAVVAGRLICGLLLDRVWPPAVAFASLFGPTIGLLVFLAPHPSLWLLAIGAAFVGLSQGAEGDLLAYFTARYFGLKAFGAIFGLLGLIFGVSVALGSIAGGYAFDAFDNYNAMLICGACVAALGAVSMLASGIIRAKIAARHEDRLAISALQTPQEG